MNDDKNLANDFGVRAWLAVKRLPMNDECKNLANLILDAISEGVFTIDKDFCIIEFNKTAERITGWKREDVIGKRCKDIFRSNICDSNCMLARSVSCLMRLSNQRVFIKTASGRTLPISIASAPLFDEQGDLIGGVETFRDITKSVEQELILDSVADGVFTVDEEFRITLFNKAAQKITGYTAEEAMGRHCHEVFRSSICGNACALNQSMKKRQAVLNCSAQIDQKSGKRIAISISAAPILDDEGNVIGGVETFRDLTEIQALRKQVTQYYTFGDIISKTASMQRIFDILPEIAKSDSNVLVLGESGTGKELIARALHNYSNRAKGPFVAVNCGALPDTLLESELFGYKAGAFTDAKKDRPGRFAAAEKGTIFLDEIGDISPALQVKLLRVLQSKTYEPLGSNQPVQANVRVIAATNKDLAALVKEGRFREDLFYRLNVVKITLPPLRERKNDIPLLVQHFINKFNVQKDKSIEGMSDTAMYLLMQYDFPGNIRELENIVEYAFILCASGLIQPQHLPEPFNSVRVEKEQMGLQLEKPLSLAEIEKRAIYTALERNRFRKMATCRELGISKDTLRRKIQLYNIELPDISDD
ncbi:MAG: sigma 54-interacting transcriptional regulator [Dissulfuribacterales bacterium]